MRGLSEPTITESDLDGDQKDVDEALHESDVQERVWPKDDDETPEERPTPPTRVSASRRDTAKKKRASNRSRYFTTETVSSSGSARNSATYETDQTIPAEDMAAKSLFTAQHKLKELLTTERTYVEKNLNEIVEGYYKYMEETKTNPEGRIKIPTDLMGGKNRIIFGNIRDIYDFHVRSILPEIEKCVDDPGRLAYLFESKRDIMKMKYGRYCLNKPKSEYIITQHNDKYFAVVRLKEGFQQALSTQMMTPIQRVTRYQLLLSEVLKNYKKAEVEEELIQKIQTAFDVAQEIAKYTNNMMLAGRIRGFEGDVTAQGLLLKRGTIDCFKRKGNLKRPKIKHCQFFIFQETIIICENPHSVNDPSSPQSFDFVANFKMNNVIVREFNKSDSNFGFELEKGLELLERSTTASRREDSAIVVQCESEEQRDEWLKVINDQIRDLKDMAKKLENPQFFC
ncbi:hypothetical protein TCAL_08466 [Tigriopus californicus]|uniref:DH domain-containing protein n=1 Tax=Tigriopus californicus TaxID=6832 RepID=A0A553N8L9_TIGCA|nr:hypothetical protein TCAL_08466 [Tigriopus californicus]